MLKKIDLKLGKVVDIISEFLNEHSGIAILIMLGLAIFANVITGGSLR